MTSLSEETVEKYARQSVHYLENAFRLMDEKEYDKASEFLWGSLAEAVKAVAASKGIKLKTHAQLWKYVRELAKELGDETVYDTFYKGGYLHSNFYEVELKPPEILAAADSIRKTVRKLLELIGYRPTL